MPNRASRTADDDRFISPYPCESVVQELWCRLWRADAPVVAHSREPRRLACDQRSSAVRASCSIAEILETQGGGEVLGAHGGDDCLQLVLALARHADFLALNLRRHLEPAVADEPGDLLRDGQLDSLLDFDDLSRVAEW